MFIIRISNPPNKCGDMAITVQSWKRLMCCSLLLLAVRLHSINKILPTLRIITVFVPTSMLSTPAKAHNKYQTGRVALLNKTLDKPANVYLYTCVYICVCRREGRQTRDMVVIKITSHEAQVVVFVFTWKLTRKYFYIKS